MSDHFGCDKILLVQAELDGELDAAEAAALAAHRASCPICQAAAAELGRARAALEPAALYDTMPDAARTRLMAAIAARSESPKEHSFGSWWRWWWSSAAGFGVGAACTAVISFLLIAPHEPSLTQQLVASHIRALQPGHLEDVISTDQHTVKPWFDGRIDFAPPVKDLAAEGYPLKGGRLDYLAGRPVAALVYQHAKHLIDLYVWPSRAGGQSLESTERQGYNVVHWRDNGMNFWAVSDLEPALLHKFAEDWRRSP